MSFYILPHLPGPPLRGMTDARYCCCFFTCEKLVWGEGEGCEWERVVIGWVDKINTRCAQVWILQQDSFFFKAVHEAGVTNLTQSPISKVNIFLPILQIEELSQDMVNVFVKVIGRSSWTTNLFLSIDFKALGCIILTMKNITGNISCMLDDYKIEWLKYNSKSKPSQVIVTPLQISDS